MKPREYLAGVVVCVRAIDPGLRVSMACNAEPYPFVVCYDAKDGESQGYAFETARLRADPFHVYWQADDGTNHDIGHIPVESIAERLIECARGRTDAGTIDDVFRGLLEFTTFKHRLKLKKGTIVIDDDRTPVMGQPAERTLAHAVTGGGGIYFTVPHGTDVLDVQAEEERRGSPVRLSAGRVGLVVPTANGAVRAIARIWVPYFNAAPTSGMAMSGGRSVLAEPVVAIEDLFNKLHDYDVIGERVVLHNEAIILDRGQATQRTLAFYPKTEDQGHLRICLPEPVSARDAARNETTHINGGCDVRVSSDENALVVAPGSTAAFVARAIVRIWLSRLSKATTPQPPPEPCMEQLTWFRDELRDALEAPTASMGEIIELLKAARAALDIACVQPGRFHERILGLRQQVVDAAALAAVNASKAAQCQSTIEDTDKVLDKAGVPFAGCDLRVRIGAVLGAREEA